MHDSEQDKKRVRVEVRADNYEVDYGDELARLVGILGQVLYEFRLSRGGIKSYESVGGSLRQETAEYIIDSRCDGQVRISTGDETYAFEADFTETEKLPQLREYRTDDKGITELTPGEDEAGCQIIATAAQIIVRGTKVGA